MHAAAAWRRKDAGVTCRCRLRLACDDDCAGALLDHLDRTHQEWRGVNISAVAVAPYRRLVALKKQTADMKVVQDKRLQRACKTVWPA